MLGEMSPLFLNLTAVIALLPAVIVSFRQPPRRDLVYWSVMLVALAGPAAWVFFRDSAGWQTGLSTALWITVVVCMIIQIVVAAISDPASKLTPLLLPYLLLLAILASIWGQAHSRPLESHVPLAWIGTHIAISVITYGLITVAATASLAAMFQERALKAKKVSALSRLLPSVADSERLVVRLLLAAEIILAAGLATGMATLYVATGDILVFDHKTVLTIAVFIVVALLLIVHFRTGVRGKVAARLVLLAYLLFSLGYPGVKFVTDILLA